MARTIKPLPNWVLTETYPAFYDSESLTAIQQTARLWARVQELITAYTEFVTEITNRVEEYERGVDDDIDAFKTYVNEKIAEQDGKIDEALADLEEALAGLDATVVQTVNQLFQQAIEGGLIEATLRENYDSTAESLDLSIGVL